MALCVSSNLLYLLKFDEVCTHGWKYLKEVIDSISALFNNIDGDGVALGCPVSWHLLLRNDAHPDGTLGF